MALPVAPGPDGVQLQLDPSAQVRGACIAGWQGAQKWQVVKHTQPAQVATCSMS